MPFMYSASGASCNSNPDLDYQQVGDLMKASADKIGGSSAAYGTKGHSLKYGYGRVNAHAAVQAALSAKAKPKAKAKGRGKRKGGAKAR